ncbi:hypothetical protein [Micromonospora sp. WMMC273]|uniref:hypothetical protein n=1 Tax=Micromonospora sp. WMMC273 TaxID=3015157 RepID=UPI0022B73E20|nr:hypothetical protein [Micromonospora sp. WMMC273]MCZ7473008.1 hypothetical protein [Micromonospora sp. WMMC273]
MRLHDLVDAVTGDEPPMSRTVDDIITAGRRAQRRRRAGFASAGAAGLVVAVVAGAFVVPTLGAQQSPPAAPFVAGAAASKPAGAEWPDPASFTFTFTGYDAGTLHVQDPIVASTAYQIAPVYSDGHTSNDKPMTAQEVEGQGDAFERNRKKAAAGKPSLWAYLTVYRPGAFDPARIKDGANVTVAGRRAVQATLPVGLDPQRPVDGGNKLFAWEYADNAWAAVTSYSGDKATPSFEELGGLVEGLKPSRPTPALLPFTVGYLPDGYVPLQIGTHATAGLGGIAAARAGDYGGATYTRSAAPTTGLTAPYEATEGGLRDGFHISVIPSSSANQTPEPGETKCYDVPDRPGWDGPQADIWCQFRSADGAVVVEVSPDRAGNTPPRVELEKIAEGITVADVTDESTWTPAATALRP